MRQRLRDLADRSWGVLERLMDRGGRGDPRRQRWLLVGAALLFVVATVLAYLGLPDRDDPVNWWVLGVVVVGVLSPLLIAVNAYEYVITARILGHRVALRDALKITIVGSAANILPVPGAAIVRVADLRLRGSPTRRALATTALVGIAWIGVAASLGALVLVGGGAPAAGAIVLLGGLVVTGLVGLGLWSGRGGGANRRQLGAVAAVETAAVVLSTARIYAVLVGLGHDAAVIEAAGLMIAGVIATATGVFPGGLGLREILAAVIAPIVGLTPALGLFATAVTRLAEYVVLGPVAVYVALRTGTRPDALADPSRTATRE